MKVFISWSGETSQKIAKELFDWLPMVLQSVQPYMSSESIDKGTRWASSIASELEGTSVGIIVLTPENRAAPWINFEAGALAKVVGEAKLAPLIFGLKPSDVGSPLSQFQVTKFERDDVLRLLKSINSCAEGEPLPEARLERMHGALWEQIESKVTPLLSSLTKPATGNSGGKASTDGTSKALEEILTLARQQAHFVMNPERVLTPEVISQILALAGSSGLDARSADMAQHYAMRSYGILKSMSLDLVLVGKGDEETAARLKAQMDDLDKAMTKLSNVIRRNNKSGRLSPNVGRRIMLSDGKVITMDEGE